MAGLIFDKAQIEQTIDAVVARTMRMDMTWDWPCGVAYYGICEAYEVTGKQEYLKLVQDRVDEYIELGLPEWTVNTCSMGHCLITLYEHTGDERYLNIAKSKVDYLENKALRFGDRVLQHTVSVNNDFPEQAWADTLFMAAFFLLRMGVLLKDAALIDDALNQYYWHIKYLQDPATGLYYHGYNNLTGDHMSGIFWGRANAWAAYTMSQVGLRLPECYLYPKFLDVVGSLNDQLAALKLLQTDVLTELVRSKLNVDRLMLRQQEGFVSVMPAGRNAFGAQFERVLPASSVANLYPFNYSGKTDPHGFYIGKDKYGANILVDFDKRDDDKTSANILILGNSGQGKSYLLKLLLLNFLEAGKSVISLDVEHEQKDMCETVGGCFMDLMGGVYRINPLEPKCWDDGSGPEDRDAPEAFRKSTRLSQHISFLKDFFHHFLAAYVAIISCFYGHHLGSALFDPL